MACSLVCDFYHREADDLFADAESLLEDLQNDIFARAFIFRVHHGVVQRGVECLAGFAERRHAELFEDAGELRHRHLHALFERLIGGLLGAVAAYFGKATDSIIMRLTDMFMAIPETLLALCVVAAMGASAVSLIVAMTVACVPGNCRLVRSTVLSIVDAEYVEAARACGMSDLQIIVKEIIPNCLGPIIVVSTQGIAGIMLTASSLSYLGMGIQPPNPEWGAMISEAREFLRSAPYTCIIPGIVIVLTALSFNLLGDGLRDAMDPRLKD